MGVALTAKWTAQCVQNVTYRRVLKLTLVLAACCVIHRHTVLSHCLVPCVDQSLEESRGHPSGGDRRAGYPEVHGG